MSKPKVNVPDGENIVEEDEWEADTDDPAAPENVAASNGMGGNSTSAAQTAGTGGQSRLERELQKLASWDTHDKSLTERVEEVTQQAEASQGVTTRSQVVEVGNPALYGWTDRIAISRQDESFPETGMLCFDIAMPLTEEQYKLSLNLSTRTHLRNQVVSKQLGIIQDHSKGENGGKLLPKSST